MHCISPGEQRTCL